MQFDLEKAKAGEPVEYKEAYGWVEIRFIGPWDSESVVCEVMWSYTPEIVNISNLRMAKKKEIVRYRNYIRRSPFNYAGAVHSLNDQRDYLSPQEVERDGDFKEWIHHDWQEYEIGANDVP